MLQIHSILQEFRNISYSTPIQFQNYIEAITEDMS